MARTISWNSVLSINQQSDKNVNRGKNLLAVMLPQMYTYFVKYELEQNNVEETKRGKGKQRRRL